MVPTRLHVPPLCVVPVVVPPARWCQTQGEPNDTASIPKEAQNTYQEFKTWAETCARESPSWTREKVSAAEWIEELFICYPTMDRLKSLIKLDDGGKNRSNVIAQLETEVDGRIGPVVGEILDKLTALTTTGPLSTEAARRHVQNGISSGTFRVPPLPEGYTLNPLHREEVTRKLREYVREVRNKANKSKEGKFPLFGSSGLKGIGKTAMQVYGAKVIVEEKSFGAVYLTFNGGGANKDTFVEAVKAGVPIRHAFGYMLMVCCGVPLEVARCLEFDDCVALCRSMAGLDDDGTLVFFIDEVGDLEDLTSDTISALMSQMDQQDGKLAFIWTHIQQEVLDREQTGSKREVIPMPLPALPVWVWRQLLPEVVEAADRHTGLRQLLLACCGHPRSLVDGMPAAIDQDGSLLTDPTEAAIIDAKKVIMTKCKFNEFLNRNDSMKETIRRWFDFTDPVHPRELARDGILLTMGDKSSNKVEFLHPLLLQDWAQENSRMSSIAYHLRQAYHADAVAGLGAEKKMESLMYHYEAVLRKAVEGKVFQLRDFYHTKYVDSVLGDRLVKAEVPPSLRLVVHVPDFENIASVLELLRQGYIVVSDAHGEAGVEYLSPYIDVNGNLVVALVQCKFVIEKTKESWQELNDKMKTLRGNLEAESTKAQRVDCFPVFCITKDQTRMNKSTYQRKGGVYFIEHEMFQFTKKLGVLRLHCEKLGKRMGELYPWLMETKNALRE